MTLSLQQRWRTNWWRESHKYRLMTIMEIEVINILHRNYMSRSIDLWFDQFNRNLMAVTWKMICSASLTELECNYWSFRWLMLLLMLFNLILIENEPNNIYPSAHNPVRFITLSTHMITFVFLIVTILYDI